VTVKEFLDTNLAGALVLIAILGVSGWWHHRRVNRMLREWKAREEARRET
jgi:hypothetical protein